MIKIVKNKKVSKVNGFNNKTIVFTGFRNEEWKNIIKGNGGNVTSTVTKNTDIVVTNNKSGDGSKLVKARNLKKTIMSVEEFQKKYKLKKKSNVI